MRLHQVIHLELRKNARFPYALARFWCFHGFIFMVTVLAYCAVLASPMGLFSATLLYMASYVGVAILAIAVGHQAFHGVLCRSALLNQLVGSLSFLLLGVDGELWSLRHRREHHPHPNTHGHDDDIDSPIFFRLAPYTKSKWYHAVQHLYAPFVYSLGTVVTVFVTDGSSLHGELRRRTRDRLGLLIRFAARKAIFVLVWFVLPLVAVPDQTLSNLICAYLAASIPVAWLFLPIAMVHLNTYTHFFETADSINFLDKQIETTIDFSPNNRFMSLLYGGLNCHLAHHLFPKVASCHHPVLYRHLSIVAPEVYQRKIELDIGQLFCSHFKFLKRMGQMV